MQNPTKNNGYDLHNVIDACNRLNKTKRQIRDFLNNPFSRYDDQTESFDETRFFQYYLTRSDLHTTQFSLPVNRTLLLAANDGERSVKRSHGHSR